MIGRPWKCGEERRLLELVWQGKTQQQMADELGRTKDSIQSHLQCMRRRDDGYKAAIYHKWTAAEIRELKRLVEQGASVKEIAERIGCRVGGAYGKINDLRRRGEMPKARMK